MPSTGGTKKQQDRKPVILLSDSACFLSSSQKWTGEGKSPSMQGNPDADIMREIIQLFGERIKQGLLSILIKIKAHRGDPLNESADRWDERRKTKREYSLVSPIEQTNLPLDGQWGNAPKPHEPHR